MRTTVFVLLTTAIAGCGSGSSSAPVATPGLPSTTPSGLPAPVTDPYSMDPAKHAFPASPVAGRLGGKPFTPDRIELQGDQLTFRQGKDFFADQEISIHFKLDPGKSPEGTRLVISPTQKWHEGPVPSLHTGTRKAAAGIPETKFVNDGYALTLEIGKNTGGKVPGKIVLCLPDAEQSYLAGAFEAVRTRAPGDPLTPDDAPFIQGTIQHAGKAGQMLTAGYVGVCGQESVSGLAGTSIPDTGQSGGWAQSTTNKPRISTLSFQDGTPRFDFVKLPPGKYLVYAKLKSGPVAWAWVTVTGGGQLTQNLKLTAQETGTVELKVPADFTGKVMLTPASAAEHDPKFQATSNLGFWLGLEGDAKSGKAIVKDVPPGKYTLFLSPGVIEPRGTVEVTAGKTVSAEITSAKKK